MKKIIILALNFICLSNAFAQVPQNGLVAEFKFNGNTIDGANLNSPGKLGTAQLTTDRFGINNRAYQFTAAYSDTISYDIALSNSDFTLAFWYKPDNTNQYCILDWRNNNNGSPLIQVSSWQNRLEARLRGNNQLENAETVKSTSLPATTYWTFCSFSLIKDSLSFYIDGSLQGKVKYTQGEWDVTKLLIGDNDWNSDKFIGKIDDIRIYNRGLQSNEIQQLFNEPAYYPQTITGLNDIIKSYSLDTIILQGISTSGLPITYKSSDTTVVKVFTNKLLVKKAGLSVITASQLGNDTYLPAPMVSINIAIEKPVIIAKTATTFCVGNKVVLSAPKNLNSYKWIPNGETIDSLIVSNSGDYKLIANGNDTSNSIVVTANSLPIVSFNSLPTMIAKNSLPISLEGQPLGGAFSGNGVAENMFNPKYAGFGTKLISYSYTDPNECTSISDQKIVVYDTVGSVCTSYDTLRIDMIITGLNNDAIENSIKIYPNPASDFLIIDNGNYLQMQKHSVNVSNSVGQTVFNSLINVQQFAINISQWTKNSVYFVKIIDDKGAVVDTKKIIVN